MIPKNLTECFDELTKNTSKEDLIKFIRAKGNFGMYHHGSGTNMRNNWGLWTNSVLAQYFNKMGIYHADDMSGIIMTSFYRYLIGEEIKLGRQVDFYIKFWKKKGFKDGNPCKEAK